MRICSAGVIQISNVSECPYCPKDTYDSVDLDNSTVCHICTEGFGIIKNVNTSYNGCKLFCLPGYGMYERKCFKCDQGLWNNGNMSMRFMPCQKCPEEYTTPSTGATDLPDCSICAPGSYLKDDSSCELCPKGSYSTNPQSTKCIACTKPFTTNHSGSTNANDCNGACYFDQQFCRNNGECGLNKNTGNYECFCTDLYSGTACDIVKDGFVRDFIAYVCGGIAAGVFIILSVALYIKCYKRRRRIMRQRQTSQVAILEHHQANHIHHEYTDFGFKNNRNAQNNEYIDVITYPAGNPKNPSYTQYDMLDDPENVYDVLYNEFQHPDDSTHEMNTAPPDYLDIISNTDTISQQWRRNEIF